MRCLQTDRQPFRQHVSIQSKPAYSSPQPQITLPASVELIKENQKAGAIENNSTKRRFVFNMSLSMKKNYTDRDVFSFERLMGTSKLLCIFTRISK